VSEGGVIIPESQARSTRGMVEAVGPKVKGLKVGDEVLFTAYPIDIELGDKMLALVRDEEIYFVL
jgi:co-chaperonin GroES (HSP10)